MLSLKEIEGVRSMPAIAAHVTDYARLYLWQLIGKAGRKNVYYCDTDSLIVNQQGFDNLQAVHDPKNIGALKLEQQTRLLEIKGAKNYRFGQERKIKGVPKTAQKLKGNSYKFQHFPTPISELRAGLADDYRITWQIKELTGEYTKGIVLPSGAVVPIQLSLS